MAVNCIVFHGTALHCTSLSKGVVAHFHLYALVKRRAVAFFPGKISPELELLWTRMFQSVAELVRRIDDWTPLLALMSWEFPFNSTRGG